MRDLLHLARRHVQHAQPAETVLVARERDAVAVGRARVRTLARSPHGPGVLERLVDQGQVVAMEVHPPSVVAHGETRAVAQRSRLAHRARQLHRQQRRAVERHARQVRMVPRHVRHVPGNPFHRCTVGGEHGVEAEVGTAVVEPTRVPGVQVDATHHCRIDDVREVSTVGRRAWCCRAGVGAVLGEAAGEPARHRLAPQVAVGGDEHHVAHRRLHCTIGIGHEAPRSTAETPRGPQRRYVGHAPLAAAHQIASHQPRVAGFCHGVHEQPTRRGKTGFRHVAHGDAPFAIDGHHAEQTYCAPPDGAHGTCVIRSTRRRGVCHGCHRQPTTGKEVPPC